jgi:hypothetical protein
MALKLETSNAAKDSVLHLVFFSGLSETVPLATPRHTPPF